MNIFVLDQNPQLAAQYHCDQHINKMILESAQMLSTVLGGPYKPTHKNHPCTLWVAESSNNAMWLVTLAAYLNDEYRTRYHSEHDHKSWIVIRDLWRDKASHTGLPDVPMTPFAQAMPDELRIPHDPVRAYRQYYRTKPFVTWDRGLTPLWWDYPELDEVQP